MNIEIVTFQNELKRGFNDFYPLIKWKNQLNNENIYFQFKSTFEEVNVNADFIWLDYRFLRKIGDKTECERDFIISKVVFFSKFSKVVLFDTADGSQSRCFWLTPYVFMHIKKQLYKDLNLYASEKISDQYMSWVPKEIINGVFNNDNSYVSCKIDQLSKLKVAWNIGYCDYRNYVFKKYIPSFFIPNFIFCNPKFYNPSIRRDIKIHYRGSLNNQPHYDFQRLKLKSILENSKMTNLGLVSGTRISKNEYLNELKNSKIVISPFGWGEICYRDFETFIYGSALMKPDMSHLNTFPDVYIPNETYIPVNWDLSNLDSLIENALIKSKKYEEVAIVGQKKYREIVENFSMFLSHIKSLL